MRAVGGTQTPPGAVMLVHVIRVQRLGVTPGFGLWSDGALPDQILGDGCGGVGPPSGPIGGTMTSRWLITATRIPAKFSRRATRESASGQSTSKSPAKRCVAIPPQRSIPYGSRLQRSSSSVLVAATSRLIGSLSSQESQSVPDCCWGRSRDWQSMPDTRASGDNCRLSCSRE